jgi:hypothetical protein
VALQALDAQLAEAVARAGRVAQAQAGAGGFGVDVGQAVVEPRVGMFAGEQAEQQRLLRVVPVGLAERAADRQRPAGDQFGPGFVVERAVDRDIDGGDRRPRPGIDADVQRVAVAAEREGGREPALGGEDFAEQFAQPAAAGLVGRQVRRQQVDDVLRPVQLRRGRGRPGEGEHGEQQPAATEGGEQAGHGGLESGAPHCARLRADDQLMELELLSLTVDMLLFALVKNCRVPWLPHPPPRPSFPGRCARRPGVRRCCWSSPSR